MRNDDLRPTFDTKSSFEMIEISAGLKRFMRQKHILSDENPRQINVFHKFEAISAQRAIRDIQLSWNGGNRVPICFCFQWKRNCPSHQSVFGGIRTIRECCQESRACMNPSRQTRGRHFRHIHKDDDAHIYICFVWQPKASKAMIPIELYNGNNHWRLLLERVKTQCCVTTSI